MLGRCQGTPGALAPCSGFLPSRPARRPSAVHDAWRLTRLNQVHQAPREKFGENSPHLLGNIEEGKSKKKSLGEAKHSLGLLVTAFPGTKTHPAIMLLAKLSEVPRGSRAMRKSDTPRGAGGLVSGAASKAVVPLVEASRVNESDLRFTMLHFVIILDVPSVKHYSSPSLPSAPRNNCLGD